MSGKSTIKNRILTATGILNSRQSRLAKEEKQKMESVLYAFACKFLKNNDLEEIKEILSMTVLGEMIWNDGAEKGREEGREEGKSISLIDLICRKLQKGKTPAQIAQDLDEELPVVERICNAAGKYAPDYDSNEIYSFLKSREV